MITFGFVEVFSEGSDIFYLGKYAAILRKNRKISAAEARNER
jgi:hypothetical protein